MSILFFFVVSSSFVLTCFLSDFRMKNFYCGRSIFVEFWDDVRKLHITSGRYKRISSRDDRNKRLASSELNRDIRGKSWKSTICSWRKGSRTHILGFVGTCWNF